AGRRLPRPAQGVPADPGRPRRGACSTAAPAARGRGAGIPDRGADRSRPVARVCHLRDPELGVPRDPNIPAAFDVYTLVLLRRPPDAPQMPEAELDRLQGE